MPGREDRGKLSALRRGFSDTTATLAWPYIAPFCDLTNEKQRTIWLTLAAAAASLIPQSLERPGCGNLGATMRRLALGSGISSTEALNSFEARFRRLLTCQTTSELCSHLPTIIRAAVAKGTQVDASQLFYDLQDWELRSKRNVPVEWARGYWVAPDRTAPQEVAP